MNNLSDEDGELTGPIIFAKGPDARIPSAKDNFKQKATEYLTSQEVRMIKKQYENKKQTTRSKQILDDFDESTLYDVLQVAEPVYNPLNLAKLYDLNPFHASAIDAKADSVIGLGYNFEYSSKVLKQLEKLGKKDESGERKRKLELRLDDARDKFHLIVDDLNVQDEFSETLRKVYIDRLAVGNAYIEIGRTDEGKIAYMGHIPPAHIRVRKSRDGFVQMTNGKTVFFRNFGDRKTKDPIHGDPNPNEIIHIKVYAPGIDDYYGVPEITSAIEAIAGIKFALQYNIDYFENKAVPRYIIKLKGVTLDVAQQKQILEFFETSIKGSSHRTVMIPLPGATTSSDKDIDFQPIETGRQEGHFSVFIKDMTQMILSRHRVPQSRIGLSSAATSQAESREAEKTFKETVCQPEQRHIEKKLNRVFAELTDLFTFRLSEYSLSDEDTRSQMMERRLRWGVTTPDEERLELKLGPRPDGKGMESLDTRSIAEIAANQAQLSARMAEDKAQNYESRTRDQNRNADNPRKNPNNRSGQRAAGQGKHPSKR